MTLNSIKCQRYKTDFHSSNLELNYVYIKTKLWHFNEQLVIWLLVEPVFALLKYFFLLKIFLCQRTKECLSRFHT